MAEETISFIITADYGRLNVEDLACVDFVKTMESRVADVPAYMLMDAADRSRDHFAICLTFSEVTEEEECRTVSAVLAFHEAGSDADFFLQHWTGAFFGAEQEQSVDTLFSAVQAEMAKRLGQGWWNETPE